MNRTNELLRVLKVHGIENLGNLEFVQADLMSDENWHEAAAHCDYVLHAASPFTNRQPKDENELIVPAREGTLRVLTAAQDSGVKRVVLTSSFAAMGYSIDARDHVFAEEDWTDPEAPVGAYVKSKTLAERAAWAFMGSVVGDLELTVINPVGIFGPAFGSHSSESLGLIQGILNGTVKESPPASFGVVDVRDVADLHISAMTHPQAAGQRFLATADGTVTIADIARLIEKQRPALTGSMARLDQHESVVYKRLSNEKAKTLLRWVPRTTEEALLASVDSIVQGA